MSEPAAPYSPRRPLRFRVWDGERMHYPDTARQMFLLSEGGLVWTDPDLELVPNAVPLLSTGLRDAEGREVFEGDIVEANGARYEVGWRHGAFEFVNHIADEALHAGQMAWARARVVGNIYETAPEPAS